LRKRRIDNGALTLASPEVRFKLEGVERDPTDLDILFYSSFSFALRSSTGK